VSEGELGGTPMALPADSLIRSVGSSDRRERLPWLAMLAAALLHALVLVWLLIDWQHPTPLPPEPKVVPIRIVTAPPAPTPPPPPAAPAPKPAPPPAFRESGPDQHTTAPPPAETTAPKPAAPAPTAPEQPTPPAEAPPMPSPPPEKPSVPQESGRPAPRKEVPETAPQKQQAERPQALHPAPRRLNVEPGERFESGDPYLNQLHALIERHRVYPRVIGPLGLPVEGTAVYDLAVDRSGNIVGMKLEHSSGVAGIDQAVANMIRSALPFPPLPPDYPNDVVITVSIRLFPPS